MHYIRPKLNIFRCYLTHCRTANFEISDQEKSMIETDFVKMRETSNFQVEHLHSLLVLSRLLGISKGLTSLDQLSWEQAKQMEAERTERMLEKNPNEA